MPIKIRPEQLSEFPAIYDLIKTAFETAPVSDGTEQDFANTLRVGEGYLPELALVAEGKNGEIIGHMMLTKYPVDTVEGEKHDVLLLAPLCVALKHRNKGIGAQLINESFRLARESNFGAVLLAGDPAYYERYGFKPSVEFGIKNENGYPDENILMRELTSGALDKVSVRVRFGI